MNFSSDFFLIKSISKKIDLFESGGGGAWGRPVERTAPLPPVMYNAPYQETAGK